MYNLTVFSGIRVEEDENCTEQKGKDRIKQGKKKEKHDEDKLTKVYFLCRCVLAWCAGLDIR